MRTFKVVTGPEGHFVCNIHGDRIELGVTERHCSYVFLGREMIGGIGSRDIGIRIFENDCELLPSNARPVTMADFFPEESEPLVPLVDTVEEFTA